MNLRFAIAGVLIAWLLFVVLQLLPQPFDDRLAKIEESTAQIDNVRPYDAPEKWAKNGSQAGLHLLNPTRVAYFDRTIRHLLHPPFQVLDIGCGGGLVSNELASLSGYTSITGVDLSAEALHYARTDAERRNLSHVSFQSASVYDLPFANGSFNVVVISDVMEHLLDLISALKEAARVLKPNGVLVFDTINRSPAAFIVAIIGAEYIVRIIDKGTHDWRLFIRPEELQEAVKLGGFSDFVHQSFDPSLRALIDLSLFNFGFISAEDMRGSWSIEQPSSMMVSYIGYATKHAGESAGTSR